jgi:hypothetical protein
VGGRELEIAIEALAAEMAPALLAEAQAEAAAQVRGALVGRLESALLKRCQQQLGEPVPRRDQATHPLVERERDSARGLYVYGVVATGSRVPADLVGVDPELPVRLIEDDELAALVSEVPLAEFGEETIRDHLNDVAWLEEKARAHEAVLETVLAASDALVPMRLCTIFAGEDQVREMLAGEGEVMLDALDRLAGKAEWGVKAFAVPEALDREVAKRTGGEEDGETPAGIAYMNRKRREVRAREEAEEVADDWARLIHDRLEGAAAETLLNPLQRSELSGNENEMLLNGVYLVAELETDRFRDRVAALQDEFDRRGVEIILTGPWPAYNFVKSSIEAAR